MLRPQGVLLAVGVSRFASLIDGAAQGFIADPAFRDIVARDLASGRHENPGKHPHYFTTAYFHKPEELCDEIQEAGGAQVLGVEGPVWSAAGSRRRGEIPQREALLGFLQKVEREPSVIGASAHVIVVGRRQGVVGSPNWLQSQLK